EHDKVVFEKKLQDSEGTADLRLPPDLAADAYAQLTLKIVASTTDGPPATLEEDFQLTPATYLTHLYTDKPMYQPGETVRFRSLTLERFSLRPAAELLSLRYTITTPDNNSFILPQGDLRKLVERGSL